MEQTSSLFSFTFVVALAAAASSSDFSGKWGRKGSDFMQLVALRGGCSDLHTGKFVIEHRSSNQTTIQRKASSVFAFDDLYDVQEVIGKGGFATVRKGVHRVTKNEYAIKSIDLGKVRADQRDSLRNEVNIMKMLDHPNVVKLYETFEDENKLHLVLELCDGGDLFEYVIMKTSIENGQKTWADGASSFVWTETRLADVARKMLSAVAYLHQRGIVHRDIKPENFLLESKPDSNGLGEIKIIDFGFSKVYRGTDGLFKMRGSAYYVAPEVILAGKGIKGYGTQCDVWSLGVVLFMLLTGEAPFEGRDMHDRIKRGAYAFPADVDVSDDAKDFIRGLLTVDPAARMSASEALRHRWITSAHGDVPIRLPSVEHLSRMRRLGRLEREALLAIGYALRRDQIRDLALTFRALDTEGKGFISIEALREGMRRAGLAEEPVQGIFEDLARISHDPTNGQVEYTSFVAACLEERCYLEQANLREAFHRFRDADGYITPDSLRNVLGHNFSAHEAVREADLDCDGRISFAEFSLMMGNRLPLTRIGWRELPLLDQLDADEVDQIFNISELRTYAPGQDLFTEGCPAESLFMLEEGSLELARVRHSKLHRDGAATKVGMGAELAGMPDAGGEAAIQMDKSDSDIILLLDATAVVGQIELLTGEKRMASCTATSHVKAREVPYAALKRLMAQNVHIGYKIMTNIARMTISSVLQMYRQVSRCHEVFNLLAAGHPPGCPPHPAPSCSAPVAGTRHS